MSVYIKVLQNSNCLTAN